MLKKKFLYLLFIFIKYLKNKKNKNEFRKKINQIKNCLVKQRAFKITIYVLFIYIFMNYKKLNLRILLNLFCIFPVQTFTRNIKVAKYLEKGISKIYTKWMQKSCIKKQISVAKESIKIIIVYMVRVRMLQLKNSFRGNR